MSGSVPLGRDGTATKATGHGDGVAALVGDAWVFAVGRVVQVVVLQALIELSEQRAGSAGGGHGLASRRSRASAKMARSSVQCWRISSGVRGAVSGIGSP
jgi:hypothetical protein